MLLITKRASCRVIIQHNCYWVQLSLPNSWSDQSTSIQAERYYVVETGNQTEEERRVDNH